MNVPAVFASFSLLAIPAADDRSIGRVVEQADVFRLVLTRELNQKLAELERPAPAAPAGAERAPSNSSDRPPEDLSRDLRGLGYLSVSGGPLALAGEMGGGATHTSQTRVFYAPGIGIWIDTAVRTHLEAQPVSDTAPAGADEDKWEAARRELAAGENDRNAAGTWRYVKGMTVTFGLSQRVIDAALTTAVDTISTYGVRIEDLPADEALVVALQFEPSSAAANAPTDGSGFFVIPSTAQHAAVKAARAVIRVPRRLLDQRARAEISRGELERMIEITRY